MAGLRHWYGIELICFILNAVPKQLRMAALLGQTATTYLIFRLTSAASVSNYAVIYPKMIVVLLK